MGAVRTAVSRYAFGAGMILTGALWGTVVAGRFPFLVIWGMSTVCVALVQVCAWLLSR